MTGGPCALPFRKESVMALKEYKWRGYTYQIADEDLKYYPGAKPINKPEAKAKKAPANKARKTTATK